MCEVRKQLQPTAIEEEGQNCYNKEKYQQISMPHENPVEHVQEQVAKGEALNVSREHVVKLAKNKTEHLKLKHVVHKENAEKRRALAANIEAHKKDAEAELSDTEKKDMDTLTTELKAETVAVAPQSFLDTAMEKFDYYSKKVIDFVTPFLERAQNFFAGSTGKLWTMMGMKIPGWATPDAMELRDLKAIFREPEFAKITFERNPATDADRTKMTELREVFLNADPSTVPQNMQEFMRTVSREALKLKGPTATTLTMQDLVDTARRTYKVKKPEAPPAQPPAAPPTNPPTTPNKPPTP